MLNLDTLAKEHVAGSFSAAKGEEGFLRQKRKGGHRVVNSRVLQQPLNVTSVREIWWLHKITLTRGVQVNFLNIGLSLQFCPRQEE